MSQRKPQVSASDHAAARKAKIEEAKAKREARELGELTEHHSFAPSRKQAVATTNVKKPAPQNKPRADAESASSTSSARQLPVAQPTPTARPTPAAQSSARPAAAKATAKARGSADSSPSKAGGSIAAAPRSQADSSPLKADSGPRKSSGTTTASPRKSSSGIPGSRPAGPRLAIASPPRAQERAPARKSDARSPSASTQAAAAETEPTLPDPVLEPALVEPVLLPLLPAFSETALVADVAAARPDDGDEDDEDLSPTCRGLPIRGLCSGTASMASSHTLGFVSEAPSERDEPEVTRRDSPGSPLPLSGAAAADTQSDSAEYEKEPPLVQPELSVLGLEANAHEATPWEQPTGQEDAGKWEVSEPLVLAEVVDPAGAEESFAEQEDDEEEELSPRQPEAEVAEGASLDGPGAWEGASSTSTEDPDDCMIQTTESLQADAQEDESRAREVSLTTLEATSKTTLEPASWLEHGSAPSGSAPLGEQCFRPQADEAPPSPQAEVLVGADEGLSSLADENAVPLAEDAEPPAAHEFAPPLAGPNFPCPAEEEEHPLSVDAPTPPPEPCGSQPPVQPMEQSTLVAQMEQVEEDVSAPVEQSTWAQMEEVREGPLIPPPQAELDPTRAMERVSPSLVKRKPSPLLMQERRTTVENRSFRWLDVAFDDATNNISLTSGNPNVVGLESPSFEDELWLGAAAPASAGAEPRPSEADVPFGSDPGFQQALRDMQNLSERLTRNHQVEEEEHRAHCCRMAALEQKCKELEAQLEEAGNTEAALRRELLGAQCAEAETFVSGRQPYPQWQTSAPPSLSASLASTAPAAPALSWEIPAGDDGGQSRWRAAPALRSRAPGLGDRPLPPVSEEPALAVYAPPPLEQAVSDVDRFKELCAELQGRAAVDPTLPQRELERLGVVAGRLSLGADRQPARLAPQAPCETWPSPRETPFLR